MQPTSPSASSSELEGVRLLVGTALFPNALQPWFLNSTVQAIRHGADVYIAAAAGSSAGYQKEVDELGLLQRTLYIGMYGLEGARTLARSLVSSRALIRSSARAGLHRALRDLPVASARDFVRALALAVPMGLPKLSLVHCHALSLAWFLLPVCRSRGIPMVVTFHGLTPEGVQGLEPSRQAEVYHFAHTVLVNTEWAREQVIELGCPRDRTHVLPQGIRLEDFPFSPRSLAPNEPLRLLSVGRLHRHKGYSDVLRALARLNTGGTRFEYRVVGSGPHRAQFQQEAADLGIADHVHFVGEKVDQALRDEYASAHVFILASVAEEGGWTETQGVVVQEAQASGKLVVATRSGGIPECVGEGCGAILVDEHDSDGICAAIEQLVTQVDAWPAWSENARQWVAERYAIENIGLRLTARYASALSGR
jgi:colanic acid/amylovoran biosynthesis glycosyltransferase